MPTGLAKRVFVGGAVTASLEERLCAVVDDQQFKQSLGQVQEADKPRLREIRDAYKLLRRLPWDLMDCYKLITELTRRASTQTGAGPELPD